MGQNGSKNNNGNSRKTIFRSKSMNNIMKRLKKHKSKRSSLNVTTDTSSTVFSEEPQAGILVRAIYNFTMEGENILNFMQGDKLYVSSDINQAWLFAKHDKSGKFGFIPKNFVQVDNGSPMSLDSWFNIGLVECEKFLSHPGYPSGTYIIRPSSDPEIFALSIRHLNPTVEIKHYQIRPMDNGGYYINSQKKFPNIHSLIDYYSQKECGLCCPLGKPYPKPHLPPVQFKEMEINRQALTLLKNIGSGYFGEVWCAKWNDSIDVALKQMKHVDDQSQRESFLEEAKLMHKLSHHRIVQILGVCSEPIDEPIYIITELMEKGALLSYLKSDEGKSLEFKDLMLMMTQIADGMAYLECKKFIHRDLRAANILVASDTSVKVADFGLARIVEDVYEARIDSKFPIRWTAPEAALDHIFSIKSDVWSFGILVYEIVTYGMPPYADLAPRAVLQQVSKGYRLPNPDDDKIHCPPELYSLMLSCWQDKPELRPTFDFLRYILEDFPIANERIYTSN